MESLQSLRNLETAFQKTRLNAALCIIGSVLMGVFAVYYAFSYAQASVTKVYAIKDGAVVELRATSLAENRLAEAKHHIRYYHELMFNLVPDPKSIEFNKTRAEFLGDNSLLSPYETYTEENFYNRLISNNMIQTFKEDSLIIDMQSSPYRAIMYGKVKITRASSVLVNSLVTTCELVDLLGAHQAGRTDNNPNGFLMQKFSILVSKKFSSEVK